MGVNKKVGWEKVTRHTEEEVKRNTPVELHRDNGRGLRVLGQMLRSTWWELTSGSAPRSSR